MEDTAQGAPASRPSRAATPLWRAAAGISATIIAIIAMAAAVAKIDAPNKAKLITLGGSDYLVETFVGIIELAIVIAILLGFRLRLCWVCIATMFGAFAGYSLSYYFAKENCGCFGALFTNTPLEFLTIKGVSTLIDIGIVLLAVGLLAWRGCKRWPIAALILAVLAGGAGFFYANHDRALLLEYREREKEKALDSANTPPQDTTPTDDPTTAPPTEARDAASVLFHSEVLADIRAQEPGGPAWYIFIYDPDCSECMELHPFFEMAQQRFIDTDDPIMRVRMFTKQELEDRGVIKFWAWPTGASMLLIRDGVLTNVYSHDHTDEHPIPDDLYEDLEVDNLAPNYPLEAAPDQE